jgi:hypothetical protein
MRTQEDIEGVLYNWATAILGNTPVLWYHQNVQRPAVDYVTLHVQSDTRVGGRAYKTLADTDGNIQVQANREIVVFVKAYGETSKDLCHLLRNSLDLPSVTESLTAQGIAFIDTLMAISDAAEIVQNKFEEREQMDLLFRYAEQDTDTTGYIDKVEVLGNDLITITIQ